MHKDENARRSRIAFIIAEISMASYGIFRIYESTREGNTWKALSIFGAVLFSILIIGVIHRLRQKVNENFFIPLGVFLSYFVMSVITDNFLYYFPILLGISCIGATFFDPRSLRNYFFISNILSVFFVYYKITSSNVEQVLLTSEIAILWLISILGSAFIYVVTSFASAKNNAAIKAQESFIGILNSGNRIVLVDSLNRVTYYSKPFVEMAHLAIPELATGRPIFDLFKDNELKFLFYDLLTNNNSDKLIRQVNVNGKNYHFEIIITKLSDETGDKLINMVDVTPVMEVKIEAEEASRAKSAFLATMSHEIRTPLNAIIGLSEIELQKKLPEDTRLYIEKIHNSGSNLLAIINDILDISKIEAGNLDLVPVEYDVPDMVNNAVYLNISRSKHLAFTLKIDETIPVKLFGDELRIKQILNNLLSNAFKYTAKGSVNFKIGWEQREENALLVFTVQDTGRGIRKENISKLFWEYSQFDVHANRNIEGTGLGLPITKNLAVLMNGTIDVESEYGKGSIFTVRIPQKIINKKPIGENAARNLELFRFKEAHQNQGLRLIRNYMPYGRVLVVDDVETNLDVAKGLMLPYGLSMDFAQSGPEAIEKIRIAGKDSSGQKYDLVLMDHMMPGMDGIEAVKTIRSEINTDYARAVPVIALTANAMTGNEELFLSSGFNGFISKPVDIMQLDTILNFWIRNKQNEATLLQAEKEKKSAETETAPKSLGIFEEVFLDGVDTREGIERFGNESAYLNVIRSYHLHTQTLLKKIKTFSGDGHGISLSEYAVTVHGIKGSSSGIYANAIASKAAELEKAAKKGDIKNVILQNNFFISAIESLLHDLGELLQKARAGEKEKKHSKSPNPVLLNELLEATKLYKAGKMEHILSELESYIYESGEELVAWLRKQVDNLEYEAIRSRLETE